MPADTQAPITVIHLLHTMAYGGVETVIINWIRGLDPQRVNVKIVVFENVGNTEQPFIDAASAAGINVETIPWGRNKPVFKATSALLRLIRETDADIVHAHNTYAHIVGLLAKMRSRIKLLCTLYVWSDFGWKRNILQWVDRVVLRFYDLVTTQCEKTLDDTVARGFRRDSLKVLISGYESHPAQLSATERTAQRTRLGVADDELVLVNVARMYPEKMQADLLRWFADIREQIPHVHLWILGTGPLESELHARCEELQLADRVRFFGFVSHLAETLALADMQVHPASDEGVPMAICAGMAAGLPIIASDVGGLPEILDHGNAGLLIPDGDEARFKQTILRMVADESERQALGARARHFVDHDYSLRVAVEQLETSYRELLKT